MTAKHCRCGIYSITTPNGSAYVGSSNRIERRWNEHRSLLRHNKHHSTRLQAAWNKHGDTLRFEVLMECTANELNDREQEFIHLLQAELNGSTFVRNVWLDATVREKFRAIHTSPKWREDRRKIASESPTRWVPVDCSNGGKFKNMADAARAFGVRVAMIRALVMTQRTGKMGVAFKLAADEWREVFTSVEQRNITRIANRLRPE